MAKNDIGKSDKVTLAEVASVAGVSPATVSRALSRPGRVNYKTAQRVRLVAHELGYRAGRIDALDEERLHGMISAIVPDINNPAFATAIHTLQATGIRRGFSVNASDSEEDPAQEKRLLDNALQLADGVLLISPRLSDTVLRKAAQRKPVVVVNRIVNGLPGVIPDLTDSMDDALRRLVELDHRAITYLAGPHLSWQEGYRWQLIKRLCAKHGLKVRRMQGVEPTYRGGWHDFQRFLDQPTTAVVAYNDVMALGFMAFLKQHDVGIPDQVSVMGIDGTRLAHMFDPPLASIIIPRREMIEIGTTMCVDMILHTADPSATPVRRCPTSFLQQTSIGAAARRAEDAG
ncbi:LacI family DNA-binding transcriptional regulator [Bifidobacterium sp. 82T24]|uniref:LacI family DNA-binding transcriptional regulator n=1 Tax=Bifidobacterium pluvialisilvae TaxID=2834436 RepID=UPI001C56BF21|nr:LacI family DNA-binding transcriptional regulator [Bifidobacterium pluvialisilvae]MBW3088753.1 LacI family DNA-binding transcriptional regulator [Bifidobacterium pluvialisilvae]